MDLRAVKCTHYRVIGRHAEAVDAVFGKDDEVHERVGLAGFGDKFADMLRSVLKLDGCKDFEKLGLAEADYDGVV